MGVGDLPVEVAGIQRYAPDHFVDAPQLADGERVRAEHRCQRGVFELGAGAFEAVVQDLVVVEGQRRADGYPFPPGGTGVRSGDRHGQAGRDGQVGDRDDAAARVPVGRAVGAQLLEV
jgi:hypothetical protein